MKEAIIAKLNDADIEVSEGKIKHSDLGKALMILASSDVGDLPENLYVVKLKNGKFHWSKQEKLSVGLYDSVTSARAAAKRAGPGSRIIELKFSLGEVIETVK